MRIIDCNGMLDIGHSHFEKFEKYPWGVDVTSLWGVDERDIERLEMTLDWAMKNLGYRLYIRTCWFYFKDKEDAIAFKLRWG